MVWDVVAVADELAAELRTDASHDRAVNEKRYLKSDIEHYGVSVPVIRKLARRFAREQQNIAKSELRTLSTELWEREVYELRKLAVNILACRPDLIGGDDLNFIESLLRRSHTWALIDDLAMNVVSPVLESVDEAEKVRAKWLTDHDFWVRRTAMLALLPGLRRSADGWDEFSRYADAMLGEEEFFIRKAIGWVLREVSKHSPELVFSWVEPRARNASAVTMREAIKYLSADQQQHLKELRQSR